MLSRDELSETAIRNMLDYKPFVDGKIIQQWFGDLEYKISSRIESGKNLFVRVQR